MLLYIHGFNSSSQSGKAQETKRWLEARQRGNEWVCPDLPNRPAKALQVLCNIIENSPTPVKLIGSSLGGFYATALVTKYNIKAVLINPAVHSGLLLRSALGTVTHYYTHESYEFTQTYLDDLTAMDQAIPAHPEKMLLMVETGDEVLDYRDAVAYYRQSHQLIFQGGDHGFTRFADVMDLIDRF